MSLMNGLKSEKLSTHYPATSKTQELTTSLTGLNSGNPLSSYTTHELSETSHFFTLIMRVP